MNTRLKPKIERGSRFRLLVGLRNLPIVEITEVLSDRIIKVKYISGGIMTRSLIDEVNEGYFDKSLLVYI